MPTHHYSAPMNYRKDLAERCSAQCNWASIVALAVLAVIVLLIVGLTCSGTLRWSPSAPCPVLVGNEVSEVTAAKSTNTDLSKLHNASVRAKNGQGIGIVQGQAGGGSATATVTAATSNSGTAQGLQSTSTSAEATSSAAAATATSSSSSSLTPSTSLSSSLANANNGGNYAQVLIIFK